MLLTLTCRSVPAASRGRPLPRAVEIGLRLLPFKTWLQDLLSYTAIRSVPRLSSLESDIVSSAQSDPSTRSRLVRAVAIFRQVGEISHLAAIPQIFPAISPQIPCWKPDHGRDNQRVSLCCRVGSLFRARSDACWREQFPCNSLQGAGSRRNAGVSAPRAGGVEPDNWQAFSLAVSLKSPAWRRSGTEVAARRDAATKSADVRELR